jgi:hypothetical protein
MGRIERLADFGIASLAMRDSGLLKYCDELIGIKDATLGKLNSSVPAKFREP